MIDIHVPPVGESISEVTLSKWLKKEGDYVARDEVICEMESEKATFELNAEQAGILHQLAREGDTLQVGAQVARIEEASPPAPPKEEAGQDIVEPTSALIAVEGPGGPKVQPSGPPLSIRVPPVGESISEVTLVKWSRNEGSLVKRDEVICELESEKATFELNAEQAGILHQLAREGDTLAIGAEIGLIDTQGQTKEERAKADPGPVPHRGTQDTKPASSETTSPGSLKATPVASAIIQEKHLDPGRIPGSGSQGRILKQDVMQALQHSGPSAPGAGFGRGEHRQKMSSLRRTLSRRLVEAKNGTAMLTTFNEVDMTRIQEIRSRYKEMFRKKYEVNLGFMSFFTKACCIALREWPALNAYMDGEELIYHDFCDMSIAVSAPKGLVVPVIRNAESLSMAQIEQAVLELATRARDNKLTLEEMTGGTFTITNGGVFGSLMSTPIINIPQSAILGMHKIQERPMAIDSQVLIRPMMYLALSYDHRIIDGRESVGFLVRVKELLEYPEQLWSGLDPVRALLGLP